MIEYLIDVSRGFYSCESMLLFRVERGESRSHHLLKNRAGEAFEEEKRLRLLSESDNHTLSSIFTISNEETILIRSNN